MYYCSWACRDCVTSWVSAAVLYSFRVVWHCCLRRWGIDGCWCSSGAMRRQVIAISCQLVQRFMLTNWQCWLRLSVVIGQMGAWNMVLCQHCGTLENERGITGMSDDLAALLSPRFLSEWLPTRYGRLPPPVLPFPSPNTKASRFVRQIKVPECPRTLSATATRIQPVRYRPYIAVSRHSCVSDCTTNRLLSAARTRTCLSSVTHGRQSRWNYCR